MFTSPDSALNHAGTRLESWKQIAAHLNRHITTVRRWEKHEGLPVHRHLHSALSSIYAYPAELDAWMKSRQRQESLSPPAVAAKATAPVRRSLAGQPVLDSFRRSPAALLGREPETDALWNVWHAALTGRRQIALIVGEVGQGKTRLTFEFAHRVSPEATVLTGAWDREALVPFAPFVTMLQWVVRTAEPATLRSMLERIAESRELVQLVPEVSKRVSAPAAGFQQSVENRRFSMFDAFAQLMVELAQACPMLLIFEDLHWADAGSLLFLRHLLRAIRNAPLCILATYREHEPERGVVSQGVLLELTREFEPTQIQLRGLAADPVRRLVDVWTGKAATPPVTDWILAATEGNPLFVTEMCLHLDQAGELHTEPAARGPQTLGIPNAIGEIFRRRLARLSPDCRKIVSVAAVLGRSFSINHLQLLLEMPEDHMLDGMQEALNARVVQEIPQMPEFFSFTHALLAETLYADMMVARRVRFHHRIGNALERAFAPDQLPLEELAYHFTEGAVHDHEKAIDYAVRAGERAQNRLALEDAARFYSMALRTLGSLPPAPALNTRRMELLNLRGRSWFQAGQWTNARTDFLAALNLLDPAEEGKWCRLLIHLAEASFWLMDVPALLGYASEAEQIADRIERNDLWADARAWVASAKIADGDVLGGIVLDRQTLSRSGGIRSFGMARAPLTLYWAGHTGEATARAEEAASNARVSSDPAFLLYALQHLGICRSGSGKYDEALSAFDEARALGRCCGAGSLLARATSMSVAPLFSLGEYARATDRAMEARDLARRASFAPPLVSGGIDLLLIYARTHDPGRAEPLLIEVQQAVENANGWHAWKWKMRLCQARAELALAKGEWTVAIQYADQAIEQSNWRHRPKYQALALMVRARARHELGVRKAVEDARAAVEIARRIADPALVAECLSVLLWADETDELVVESRQAIDQVLSGVTDASLRRSFLARIAVHHDRQTRRKLHPVATRSYA